MKRTLLTIGLLAVLPIFGLDGTKASAQMAVEAGFRVGHAGFFYESLRPYGEWIEVDAGFYAWRPLRVQAGWRPYLYGRWTWTDYGWYWVSQEPFGWAVFHYGRWYYDDFNGWVWIPDDVWGPAWVEWRYNDDCIGWAPLPPYATFNISIGIRFTTRWIAPPDYWCFVRYGHFGSTRINTYVMDRGYTQRLIRTTRTAMRYDVDRDRIVNRGVDRNFIERRGNFRIDRADVTESRDRNERVLRESGRDRIEVYRPNRTELDQRADRIEARRPERRLSLDMGRIERNRNTETIQRREGEQRTFQQNQEKPQQEQRKRETQTNRRRETTPPANRQATPERRRRDNEFRSIQPEKPRMERAPERRDNPSVRPEPKKGNSPSRQGTGRRGKVR